jgi:hypothetical protein
MEDIRGAAPADITVRPAMVGRGPLRVMAALAPRATAVAGMRQAEAGDILAAAVAAIPVVEEAAVTPAVVGITEV